MSDNTGQLEQETKPRGAIETFAAPVVAPIIATVLLHIPAYMRYPRTPSYTGR